MKPISKPSLLLPDPSRRRFIEGLAAGAMLLGLPPWIKAAQARETTQLAEILTGTEFDLTIAETPVNFTGAPRMANARGTLATRAGMTAAVPAPDKPELLTMGDMMGDGGMAGMNHGGMAMDHSAHAMGGGQVRVRHAGTEYGASVDMRVDTPRTNLDDPGIGLRNNGRRVLTYADLHTLGGPLDPRKPDREIEIHLTGNMERYSWSLDGLEFGKSTPVHFRYGERLRVIFVNDTMMTHPMHLHGMWSELESPDGRFQVRKHTIIVQPA